MPMSMVNSRLDVINWLQKTDNISEISRQTGHSRSFIRSVRDAIQSELKNKLGARIKVNNDVQNQIFNLTIQNRRMTGQQIADIVSNYIFYINTFFQKR